MARVDTSGFAKYNAPGLRKVYFHTLSEIPKEARQLLTFLPQKPAANTGLHFFDDLELSSLGTAMPKPEGEAVSYVVPVQGNTVRYTPYAFAAGFRITLEQKADDIYGPMTRMSQQLALSCMHQIEVQSHRPINLGFATTGDGTGAFTKGFDQLALFSNAHTTLNSGVTRANRMTTDEDLSVTALEHALDLFDLWVNNSGMPTPRKAAVLVVPPQLKWIAKEITESELKPYTNNNEVNPLGGEGLRYFVDHYLSDADSWYLLAPKAEMDINVWMRMDPQFDMGDDFDTGDSKAKSIFRMAVGHGQPDGTFGSLGA
jgi:hypothetical protein